MIQIYIQRLCHQVVYIGQLNLMVVNGLVHLMKNGKTTSRSRYTKRDVESHKDEIIAELSFELIKTQEELSDGKDISDLTIQLLGRKADA